MRLRLASPLLLASVLLATPTPAPHAVYIPFSAAKPVIENFKDSLPAELKGKTEPAMAAAWPQWVRQQDLAIRARLEQGEEDSLANLLMFGTSFTRQPRLTYELVSQADAELATMGKDSPKMKALQNDFNMRIDDLVRALSSPGANERLLHMRRMLEKKGYNFSSDPSRVELKRYLLANLVRVRKEFQDYSKEVQAARAQGPDAELEARSRLFQTRGLALDTSLEPDYGLEEALKDLQKQKLLAPGSVKRVAIIGPGLDFVDKQEGYDFYPLQTIQPFAVIDSLLRLGLAKSDALQVTTLDISTRVNAHIREARARASKGVTYTLQLPLATNVPWKEGMVSYWKNFGDHIGKSVPPVSVPSELGQQVNLRAVRLPPSMVLRITPEELNAVWQRLELSPGRRFDLVIATNVLVYYDPFQQALALDNIAAMLQPGGFFLCNNLLPEVPSLPIHSRGLTTTEYSDRRADGDQMIWYHPRSTH
jgi:SAM-dependent methyltransferase